MYRPTAFQEDSIEKLVSFMRTNSFATLVSIVENVPFATHIPLVVVQEGDAKQISPKESNRIKLMGHLAKQNPQAQVLSTGESLAIFTGAHAYISPTLYEKRESVPTWNYIAVHAYGVAQPVTLKDSPDSMNEMIDGMINAYEADYRSHWHSLSNGYREGMMNGIVGFEMTVTRLEGKYKLSQNRSQTEQENVIRTLLESDDPAARAIGLEMQRNLEATRNSER